MSNTASTLLREWLGRRTNAPALAWFDAQLALCHSLGHDAEFEMTWGLIPRRMGKASLALTAADVALATQAVPGWHPEYWGVNDAARIVLLSGMPGSGKPFATRFRSLCQTADAAELVTLYRGLPLYPDASALLDTVGDGLRSNMRDVFEAIVHHNPFPQLHFDEHRWNHMVVKALFVGSALAPIEGLDERANPALARIICDFAQERRAAGRPMPHEMWRCVGPFASGSALDLLEAVLETGTPIEKRAAALALAACPDTRAAQRLAAAADQHSEISTGRLTWATLQ